MNSQNLQNYQNWSKDQFTKTLQNLDDIYYNGRESDVIVSGNDVHSNISIPRLNQINFIPFQDLLKFHLK